MSRYELYENGVLVESSDTRTVPNSAAVRKQEIKDIAAKLITETGIDWRVIRELTGGEPVSLELKEQVQQIRDYSSQLESEVDALTNTAETEDDHAVCDEIEKVKWVDHGAS